VPKIISECYELVKLSY